MSKKKKLPKAFMLSAWIKRETPTGVEKVLFNGRERLVFYPQAGDNVDASLDLGVAGVLHIDIREAP